MLLDIYKKYQAAYWVINFENTSNNDTEILSYIKDCDMSFAFNYDAPSVLSYKPDPKVAKVIRTVGSNNSLDEWQPKEQLIFPGKNYTYTGALPKVVLHLSLMSIVEIREYWLQLVGQDNGRHSLCAMIPILILKQG